MKIYLVRHTSVNVPKGVCYGQTDVPLNNTFETEAEKVKQNLNGINFDAVFSSPLSRCTRLAHYCGFNDIITNGNLKELHFGDWEMQRWNDVDMSVWDTDWVNNPAPNGESFIQMYNRVASFFEQLSKENFESVIIFTHGGVISCARVYFEKRSISETFNLMPQYGEICEFSFKY